MTPPINSVSDHILQGIAAGDLAASPFEVVSIAKELAARRAANTPVDGWVLVPRKATDQMYVAFRDQLNEGGHIYRFVEAYEAMLAAAPTSPAAEPASVCDGQLCYYHGCQGLAECAQGKPHHPAPSASREVTGFDSLNDDITNILDEHDLSQVLQDSMHEDIAQLIWSVINRCGNYVADHDTYPKEVHFSNGRVVKLSANGAYLTVGQALTLPEREG